ncbi:hypothetical protein AAEH73_21770, partial [Shewanella algae]|uniref:hypothetical protein n=1 Tax=Shewanella algae TaxID=38313 RepID=UPI00313F2480
NGGVGLLSKANKKLSINAKNPKNQYTAMVKSTNKLIPINSTESNKKINKGGRTNMSPNKN